MPPSTVARVAISLTLCSDALICSSCVRNAVDRQVGIDPAHGFAHLRNDRQRIACGLTRTLCRPTRVCRS